MKRILCLLLALVLLCGCTPAPETPGQSTEAPQTTGAALVGPETLTADAVLFYRQDDFDGRQGTLLPLETVRSAPAEALLPRTHLYDDMFPGDGALLLRLLDYALANGYQGFSVLSGTVPTPDAKQYRALKFTYRIDDGAVLSAEKDGCMTVWYQCKKPDAMEKFSLGLAAAREIAAQAPQGDDWETAIWLFSWLGDNVSYGDRNSYYFKRGHQLHDALVERDCVCSGYADALYYLCNLCGVECLAVFGLADDPETAGGLGDHVWNLVRIYGSWYVCDPTRNACVKLGAPAIAFGLSSETMYLIGKNSPTGEYTDESLIPACASCFDPVTAWNGSPEGALKSWLWFAAYCAMDPSFLLLQAGLLSRETKSTSAEDGRSAWVEIPYGTFSAWIDRFMSEEARADFPYLFSEAEDGGLTLQKSETDTRSFWRSLTLRAVADNGDGTYTADLGAANAVFTVSETDGLYRIETMELTLNN